MLVTISSNTVFEMFYLKIKTWTIWGYIFSAQCFQIYVFQLSSIINQMRMYTSLSNKKNHIVYILCILFINCIDLHYLHKMILICWLAVKQEDDEWNCIQIVCMSWQSMCWKEKWSLPEIMKLIVTGITSSLSNNTSKRQCKFRKKM